MKNFFSILTLSVVLLLVSCSKNLENRTASEFLSAYLNENNKVVAFGKVDVGQILDKAGYKSIPKLSVLLKSEMKQYEAALDVKQGVCFAIEGPLTQEGLPEKLVAFVKVKNADSLASKITSLGLMLEDGKDFKFAKEKEMSIGIGEHVAVFVMKPEAYKAKEELTTIFEKVEGDVSNGKVETILAEKGDILAGINFANLYGTSNTSLSKMNAKQKKEFDALVYDSYISMAMNFENGQATIDSKNLLNDALMKHMYLKDDTQGSILSKLGTGNARLGFAMNMDVVKLENFITEFYPNFKQELGNLGMQFQMALSLLGDKPVTNLLDGKMGMVLVGDMNQDGSMVPEVNLHLGLGNKGKEIKEMIQAFMPAVESDDFHFHVNDYGINVSTSKSTETQLNIPPFASNFGKKGFTAFANFDGMSLKSMELQDAGKMLYALKYIWAESDNKSSKIIIKAKKENQNILKQIVDVYVSDLENTISKIN